VKDKVPSPNLGARRSAQPLGASLNVRASVLAALGSAVVSGCCAFAPCHPLVSAAGRITSVTGEPIAGADVQLHNMKGKSDVNGCFRLSGGDALPFEIRVSAAGFKALSAEAKSGIFQVEVLLAPQDSANVSVVKWTKSRKVPPSAPQGCT
jgi:hypothetical protein